jgi:hypothetical protein
MKPMNNEQKVEKFNVFLESMKKDRTEVDVSLIESIEEGMGILGMSILAEARESRLQKEKLEKQYKELWGKVEKNQLDGNAIIKDNKNLLRKKPTKARNIINTLVERGRNQDAKIVADATLWNGRTTYKGLSSFNRTKQKQAFIDDMRLAAKYGESEDVLTQRIAKFGNDVFPMMSALTKNIFQYDPGREEKVMAGVKQYMDTNYESYPTEYAKRNSRGQVLGTQVAQVKRKESKSETRVAEATPTSTPAKTTASSGVYILKAMNDIDMTKLYADA